MTINTQPPTYKDKHSHRCRLHRGSRKMPQYLRCNQDKVPLCPSTSFHGNDFNTAFPTDIIQKRRLMLLGHLARMDETADARRILTGVHQSDWSRPVGRPYTSWMATLKSDLSLHNLTFKDAIELAMDKPLWRLLVASGATH